MLLIGVCWTQARAFTLSSQYRKNCRHEAGPSPLFYGIVKKNEILGKESRDMEHSPEPTPWRLWSRYRDKVGVRLYFKTRFHYVTKAGPSLPLSPRTWDCRHEPPYPALMRLTFMGQRMRVMKIFVCKGKFIKGDGGDSFSGRSLECLVHLVFVRTLL